MFGLDISLARKSSDGLSIDTVLRRIEALHETASGINVTPDTATQSPTVQALVSAISKRIATLPLRVMKKTQVNGRDRKEVLPNHPVARLLSSPNKSQDRVTFWLDATSWLVRYGNFYAFKARGVTGPIMRLEPLQPGSVTVKQDEQTLAVSYETKLAGGFTRTLTADQVMHARGAARDGLVGDSPIMDVSEAIALEIASEKMGAALFGNGAMPSLVFKFQQGVQGFKTDEEGKKFIEDFQSIYAKRGRFKGMLLPKGMDVDSFAVENDKAQFLATRQYQRTVIAGAFGVPPHMVGDLSKGTFNNVEQQSLAFIRDVTLPYARIFEAAMERSLLTDEDRRNGVVIRFNLDAALRADFATRQSGLNTQRQAGVINVNEWREMEGMNPIRAEDGGEEYWRKGPSGQTAEPPGDTGATEPPAEDDDTSENEDERNDD
jgi:HK97 family phage portal protein